jgi:hypothetical protein
VPGLWPVPVPAQFLRLPAAAVAPDEKPGRRLTAGARLPGLCGGAEAVFAAVADLWRGGGCRVSDAVGLDGRLTVAHDAAGYLLVLAREGAADPILTVASPPLSPRRSAGAF